MRLNGFVELTEGLRHDTLRFLVTGAYRISRERPVVLALNGVEQRLVDRLLDPAVQADACHSSGVWYLEARPIDGTLLRAAKRASFVIAVSDQLADALEALGVRYMREEEGVIHMMSNGEVQPWEPLLRGAVATL